MRDLLPSKPRKGYKLRQWVTQVEDLRTIATGLLDGSTDIDGFLKKIEDRGQFSGYSGGAIAITDMGRQGVADTFKNLYGVIELYRVVGHDISLRGISLSLLFNRLDLFVGKPIGF